MRACGRACVHAGTGATHTFLRARTDDRWFGSTNARTRFGRDTRVRVMGRLWRNLHFIERKSVSTATIILGASSLCLLTKSKKSPPGTATRMRPSWNGLQSGGREWLAIGREGLSDYWGPLTWQSPHAPLAKHEQDQCHRERQGSASPHEHKVGQDGQEKRHLARGARSEVMRRRRRRTRGATSGCVDD